MDSEVHIVYTHAYVYIAVIITEEVMNVKGSIRIQEETGMEKGGNDVNIIQTYEILKNLNFR